MRAAVMLFVGVAGCGGAAATINVASPPFPTVAVGADHQFVVSRLLLPPNNTTYAYDLTGIGHKVNAFAGIIQAVSSQGFNVQADLDMWVNSAVHPLLLTITTSDPTLHSDGATGGVFYAAEPKGPCAITDGGTFFEGAADGAAAAILDGGAGDGGATDPCLEFKGADHLDPDTSTVVTGAALVGEIAADKFSSRNPAKAPAPADLSLRLFLFSEEITLPLHGVHLDFTSTSESGSLRVLGEIQGSIKKSDIPIFYGPIAHMFNLLVLAPKLRDPEIFMIFDDGGCTNPDGTSAFAGDGHIDPCEVGDNDFTSDLFAPDIQVYDASGNYQPNPRPTMATKDSLSFCIGFEAVPATY